MKKPICEVHRLGMMPYKRAWDLQNRLAKEIAAGERPGTLLLLEHPHTYTFGRRGDIKNLLWEERELSHRGIAVHWVDRGGDITYHGPGQLVGYPILPLAPGGIWRKQENEASKVPQVDYVGFLRKLEQVIISALAKLGVSAGQVDGLTGVWVRSELKQQINDQETTHPQLAKIVAIGVKVDANGISRHGFALNVNVDMSYWDGIIACGLKDHPAVNLSKFMDQVPSMEKVKHEVTIAFGDVFGYAMVREAVRASG